MDATATRIVRLLEAEAHIEDSPWDPTVSENHYWRFSYMNGIRDRIQQLLCDDDNDTAQVPFAAACCLYCHKEVDKRLQMFVREMDHIFWKVLSDDDLRRLVKRGLEDAIMRWQTVWQQRKAHPVVE